MPTTDTMRMRPRANRVFRLNPRGKDEIGNKLRKDGLYVTEMSQLRQRMRQTRQFAHEILDSMTDKGEGE